MSFPLRRAARAFAAAAAEAAAASQAGGGAAAAVAAEAAERALAATSVAQHRTRNFGIVAHVDHGKSTLADRLMERTGALGGGGNAQYLDRLPVERERGITVKAQSVSLVHGGHLLNLIDTPGHVDFAYEVSRSLAACDGAVLLVDATQGVEAQTLANFYLAIEQDCAIVPVINKVDSPLADADAVSAQMAALFGVEESEIIRVSAKTGLNVESVMDAVIERVAPPAGDPEAPLRALLLDSHYDPYRGAVSLVRVVDGELARGDRIASAATGETNDVMEIGVMVPEPQPVHRLRTGQLGYVITGARTTANTRIGDTLHHARDKDRVLPLPGFRPAKPTVFQGLFPMNAGEYDALRTAIEKLTLNDSSVSVGPEQSNALGLGFRCGFLGLLHADVFRQRLRDEYGSDVISTSPTVPYRVTRADGSVEEVRVPSDMPDPAEQKSTRIEEPMVEATIICPGEAVGAVVELCVERRGSQTEHTFIGANRAMLRYKLPLGEIAADFADEIKSRTAGYATFDFDDAGYAPADVVRLDIMVNGESVDALSCIVHRSKAQRRGRELATRMKALLSRQLFEVAIQAAVGGKVVARESLGALRKNVIAKCYGGDVSRKKKLLEKQKEGKRKMKRIGSVDIPTTAFSKLLSKDT